MPRFRDNYFTNDSYSLRAERLKIIQNYILDWSGHLSLPKEILDWGVSASNRWQGILKKVAEKKNLQNNIFIELKEKDQLTFKYYLKCKRLLISKHSDDSKLLHRFGVDLKFPRKRAEKIEVVKKFIKIFYRNKEQNEFEIIPIDFILKLEKLLNTSEEIFEQAHANGRSTSSSAVKKQIEIFKEDSKKLRSLYSWTLMTWESDEPYLVQLGFSVKQKNKNKLEDKKTEELE